MQIDKIDADIAAAKQALANREAALATATEAVSRLTAERALALADGETAVRLRTQAAELQRQVEDHELALPVLRARLADLLSERDRAAIREAEAELSRLDVEARAVQDDPEAAETLLALRRAALDLAGALYAVLAPDGRGYFYLDPRRRAATLYAGVPDALRRSVGIAKAPIPDALQVRVSKATSALPAPRTVEAAR